MRLRLFILFSLLFLAAPAWCLPAYVQSKVVNSAPSATSVMAFTSNNTLHNLLITACTFFNPTGTITATIADTQTNTWPVARGPDNGNSASSNWGQSWYVADSKAGANTVTVTWSAAAFATCATFEYSGLRTVTPLDVSSFGHLGTGTALDSGNTATTTEPTELLFGYGGNESSNRTFTAAGGFTQREATNGGGQCGAWQDKVVTSTGAYNSTMTMDTTDSWVMSIITFKGPTGGAAKHRKRGHVI